MHEPTDETLLLPTDPSPSPAADPLTEVLRRGARSLLAQAVEAEVGGVGRRTGRGAGRGRAKTGRPQRPPAGPLGAHRRRAGAGAGSAGAGQAAAGRAGGVHLRDPPAVPAQGQEPRRADPMAVPQGRQHRRLRRGPRGARRPRRPGALGVGGHAAQGRVGGRVPAMVDAGSGRPAVRLPLGRRGALQRPAGRGPHVHPGADGRDGRRAQGADRGRRRLPRERAELVRTADGRQATRPERRPEARDRRRRPWASGRRCPRSGPPRVPNVAGCTRPPTC